MFSHKIGHGEVHNLGYSSERVQVCSDRNCRSKTRIQSKRQRHPLSKIPSSNGDVLRQCSHIIDNVSRNMLLWCLSKLHQKARDGVHQGIIIYNNQEIIVSHHPWHEELLIWTKNTKHRLLFYKLISYNGRCIKGERSNAPILRVTLLTPLTDKMA